MAMRSNIWHGEKEIKSVERTKLIERHVENNLENLISERERSHFLFISSILLFCALFSIQYIYKHKWELADELSDTK